LKSTTCTVSSEMASRSMAPTNSASPNNAPAIGYSSRSACPINPQEARAVAELRERQAILGEDGGRGARPGNGGEALAQQAAVRFGCGREECDLVERQTVLDYLLHDPARGGFDLFVHAGVDRDADAAIVWMGAIAFEEARLQVGEAGGGACVRLGGGERVGELRAEQVSQSDSHKARAPIVDPASKLRYPSINRANQCSRLSDEDLPSN
jgi:hypothetical protein